MIFLTHLKDKCSTFSLLLPTQFKMLASLQRQLSSIFALITFQTQNNLLCSFGLITQVNLDHYIKGYLLMKDGFSLTTITTLFSVVSPFSLGYQLSGLEN